MDASQDLFKAVLESVRLGNEICFTRELDQGGTVSIDLESNQPLSGETICTLFGIGKPTLSEQFFRLGDVTTSFCEDLETILEGRSCLIP